MKTKKLVLKATRGGTRLRTGVKAGKFAPWYTGNKKGS